MPNPVAVENTVHLYTADDTDHPLYREILVWCPGCDSRHHFTIELLDPEYRRPSGQPEPVWTFDGNMERPTFSPSMLAYYTVHLCEGEHEPEVCVDPDCAEKGHLIMNWDRDQGQEVGERILGHNTPHTRKPAFGNCHSFLRNGRWEFLSDSAHALAGKTAEMCPLPNWVIRDKP